MTGVFAAASISAAGVTAFVVAVIGAGATFIIGMMNYRRQGQALRLQDSHQQRQLAVVLAGQVTDRFMRSIDQLGSGSTHVRMGGIFAMERIARDSPEDRQHITDLLAAFVRQTMPAAHVGDGGYVRILQLRAPDAQAALTVLCRSPLADERIASRQLGLLDLSRTDLRRANLRGARLDAANLWGARLEGADMCDAILVNSVLEHANLGRIDANNDHFQRGANLSGADLTGARITGVFNLDAAVTEGTVGL